MKKNEVDPSEINSDWNAILDEVKHKNGIKSDAKLASQLGVTRGFISAVRNGRKTFSTEKIDRIVGLLRRKLTSNEISLYVPINKKTNIQPNKKSATDDVDAIFARANGYCELCRKPAPFLSKAGKPFLLITKIDPKAFEPTNLCALCPNCKYQYIEHLSKEDVERLSELPLPNSKHIKT